MTGAVRQGLQVVLRTKRMWLVFWVYTVAFALAVAAPAAALLWGSLGHSLYAGRMLEDFDIQWVSEFLLETRGWPVAAFSPLVALVAAGYLLGMTFLTGGALAVFASREPVYESGQFYRGCGKNFGRLFRLLLVSLVFYGMVLAANAGLARLGSRVWSEGIQERPLVIFGWLRGGAALALLLLVNMVFDYAKIRLVVEDSRRAARAAWAAFALAARNPGRTTGTYVLVGAIGVALLLVYAAILRAVPRTELHWLALALVIQQTLVPARMAVKLLLLASEMGVYREIQDRQECLFRSWR